MPLSEVGRKIKRVAEVSATSLGEGKELLSYDVRRGNHASLETPMEGSSLVLDQGLI